MNLYCKIAPFFLLLMAPLACGHSSTEQSSAKTPAAEQPSGNSFSVEYLMGKFDPARHPDFVEIPAEHANRSGMFMRRDAYEAFQRMYQAALQDGIRLQIISAARNFDYQKGIWEAKWTGARQVDGQNLAQTMPQARERALKILEYSAMPGASRHHWGTDIDLNDLNPDYFRAGLGKKIFEWLRAHAGEYGFCQPYSPKGAQRPEGYNEEHWHWSYMPVSTQLTELARAKLKNEMITGFKGAEAAKAIDVVGKYVLGVNPECL